MVIDPLESQLTVTTGQITMTDQVKDTIWSTNNHQKSFNI